MEQKKLLVIHQGALGDFVVSFPGILGIKGIYGQIDVICQGQLGRLAKYLNIAAQAYPLESAASATLYSGSPDIRMQHLLKTYDAIVLFSFSTDLEDSLYRITQNNVYRIAPRPDPKKKTHVAHHIIDKLKTAGLIDHMDKPATFSPISFGDTENPQITSQHDRILIHPGSGSLRKNWPVSRFIVIGNRLKSMGMKPEFILGPADHHLKDTLNRMGEKITVIDDLVVLAKELQQSMAFMGNDSGISHLSAYLRLPTVVIFGPSDPKRWGPLGVNVRVVGPNIEGLDCTPCFEKPNISCDTRDCLINLSQNQVLDAFLEIIQTR